MEREGELVLQLLSNGAVIYSVAFTFIAYGSKRLVAVGCLQGGRSDSALEQIGIDTRDLSGLHPKNLMVRLVQRIGHELGCSELVFVGNANRVMHQQIRKGRVLADYDQTWNELGAVEKEDGDYTLVCAELAALDLTLIPSSKRSAARKPFALLTSIAHDVGSALRPRRNSLVWLPVT